ncbi:MAG: hypothetical protein M3Y09_04755 [Actinomycetota bacterium]|nr:hypothetical protein [Actinomycetota bacterium]
MTTTSEDRADTLGERGLDLLDGLRSRGYVNVIVACSKTWTGFTWAWT